MTADLVQDELALDGSGTVTGRWNHSKRTFTDLTTNPPTVRNYTPEENERAESLLRIAATGGMTIRERVERIEKFLWGTPPTVPMDPADPTVKDWTDPTGAVDAYRPNALVRFRGSVWQNVSGGFLVHSPEVHPQGWKKITPAVPVGPQPYAPNTKYAAGDRVTYNGKTYQCLTAHTGSEGWTPTAAPTVWKVVAA